MRAPLILRSLLVGLMLVATSGCFVFDEMDKSSDMIKGPSAKEAPSAGGAKVAATPGTAKPGDAAKAAGAPAAPSAKSWWQTARSLGSEESDAGITRCELKGRAEFMQRDDCLSRGGVPK